MSRLVAAGMARRCGYDSCIGFGQQTQEPVMKRIIQPAALSCFAIAALLYLIAATRPAAGGFALIGGIFELMAWRKWLG